MSPLPSVRRLGLLGLYTLLSTAGVVARSVNGHRPRVLQTQTQTQQQQQQQQQCHNHQQAQQAQGRGRRFLGVPWGGGRGGAKALAVTCSGGAGGGSVVGQFVGVVRGAKGHLVAAAAARAVSIFAMYPVDTIKTRLQMGQTVLGGAGVGGLYRGLTGSMLGQVPYGTLTFGSYEVYKEQLKERFPKLNLFSRTTIAAIMGDITGSFWLCPSEVLKQQLQGGMFPNMVSKQASKQARKEEGGEGRGGEGSVLRLTQPAAPCCVSVDAGLSQSVVVLASVNRPPHVSSCSLP